MNWTFRPPEPLPRSTPGSEDELDQDLDIAVDGNLCIHAIWMNEESCILYSHRGIGEPHFTRPVTLNSEDVVVGGPQIEVSKNGSIHAVWVETLNESDTAPYNSTTRLVWSSSYDGGSSWTPPREMVSGVDLRYPSLAISARGRYYVSLWRTSNSTEQNGTAGTPSYRLVLLKWLDDTENVNTTVFPREFERPVPCHQLLVDEDGEAYAVFFDDEHDQISLYRSIKNGNEWRISIVDPGSDKYSVLGLKGAFIDEDTMVLAWSEVDQRNPGQAVINTHIIEFSEKGMEGHGGPEVPTELRYAPSIAVQASGNAGYVVFLRGGPNENSTGQRDTSELSVCGIYVTYRGVSTSEYVMRVTDGSQSHNISDDGEIPPRLVLCMENDGFPVLAVTNLVSDVGTPRTLVWRSNHPPPLPMNLTSIDGDWILGSQVVLAVVPTEDIDGDSIEYRFRLGPENGSWTIQSDLGPAAFFNVGRIEHDSYSWSVVARDPFNGSSGWGTGWWFRVDIRSPTADAGGYYFTLEGSSITLDGSGSTDDGPLVLWEWDVDGDGTYDIECARPFAEYEARDDTSGWITLRVTDEAGRRSVATQQLIVTNVAPTIEIVGPTTVVDEAQYTAEISDPSDVDVLTVSWAVDGVPASSGQTFHYIPHSLHEHLISASVADDDGGSASAIISIEVLTAVPIEIEVLAPEMVIEHHLYELSLGHVSLGLYDGLDIVWMRNGVQVGVGDDVSLIAGHGPYERTDVGVVDNGQFVPANSVNIRIREALSPVTCTSAQVSTYYSIVVRWNASEQRGIFEKYIVRLTSDPLPPLPASTLDWLSTVEEGTQTHVEATLRTTTSHEFTGLKPGRTYYACVYTVSGEEVACSNSMRVSIPQIGDEEDKPPDENGDEIGLLDPVIIVIIITMSIIILISASMLVLKR